MSGGIISGNSCTSSANPNWTYGTNGVYGCGAFGGGIDVNNNSSILKTGGIIYGNEASGNDADGYPLKNTAQSDSGGVGGGHAVFYNKNNSSLHLRRNSTTYETNNMNSDVSGSAGGWE